MQKKAKIIIAVIVLALIVGVGIIIDRVPLLKNTFTSLNPGGNKAVLPSDNLYEQKEGNELGKVLSSTKDKSYTQNEINQFINRFYVSDQRMPAKYSIDHYSVVFNTTDEKNNVLAVTGQLYVPVVNSPQKFPVWVHGAGTTGIDDKCAPSKEIFDKDNWGDYNAQMLSLASQGYIIFFPDYEGFNDLNRIHHYFTAELEGRTLLDGARAVYDFFAQEELNTGAEKAVFFAGYSQGGHAAYAANDIANSYAPDIPIKGVIGYAPAINIRALLLENPRLAPYLMVSYKDLYGPDTFKPQTMLKEEWLVNLDKEAQGKCISEAIQDYPNTPDQMYNEEFLNALHSNFASGFPEAKTIFEKNNAGYAKDPAPFLVLQGTDDPIVTQKTQEEFIRESCRKGNTITYNLYQGINHYQTRQVSFKDSINWIQGILNNQKPQSDCNNI